MKRAIGAVLAAVILMVSCLSGCGGWTKDSFPDNSSLKLSATKDKIVKAQGLAIWPGTSGTSRENYYYTDDSSPTDIAGVSFRCCCIFDENDILQEIHYSAFDPVLKDLVMDSEINYESFTQIKKQFDSVYGYTEEYTYRLEDFVSRRAEWDTVDDKGNSYQVQMRGAIEPSAEERTFVISIVRK